MATEFDSIGEIFGGIAAARAESRDKLKQEFKLKIKVRELLAKKIEGLNGLSAVQQEIIDTNVFRNLLTDFIVPSTFTFSAINVPGTPPNGSYTLSAPVRQDLEFNQAANRRFIMFRSNTPIQNVALEITAVYRDGTRNRIRMPRRSIMEVKLAFWRKSA